MTNFKLVACIVGTKCLYLYYYLPSENQTLLYSVFTIMYVDGTTYIFGIILNIYLLARATNVYIKRTTKPSIYYKILQYYTHWVELKFLNQIQKLLYIYNMYLYLYKKKKKYRWDHNMSFGIFSIRLLVQNMYIHMRTKKFIFTIHLSLCGNKLTNSF